MQKTAVYKATPETLTVAHNAFTKKLLRGSSRYALDATGEIAITKSPRKSYKPERNVKRERHYRLNKKKVRSKVDSIFRLNAARKFIAFYSISFPSGLSDDSCHQVMNTGLTRIRKICPKFTYLWVTERQQNGTLHFHMLTLNFLNIRVVNHFFAKAIKNVIAKNGESSLNYDWRKYNGCDVRRIYRKSGIRSYISKYVTKNQSHFTRLAWNCSTNVSRLFTERYLSPLEFDRIVNRLDLKSQKTVVFSDHHPAVEIDFYTWAKAPPKYFFSDIDSLNEKIVLGLDLV